MTQAQWFEVKELYATLNNFNCTNKDNVLSGNTLTRYLGGTPKTLREVVRNARRCIEFQMENGVIVSTKKGYYITFDTHLIVKQILSLQLRARDIIETTEKMGQLLKKKEGIK